MCSSLFPLASDSLAGNATDFGSSGTTQQAQSPKPAAERAPGSVTQLAWGSLVWSWFWLYSFACFSQREKERDKILNDAINVPCKGLRLEGQEMRIPYLFTLNYRGEATEPPSLLAAPHCL